MERDRALALVLRAVLLGLFLWMVKGILVPIALGGLFALVLQPLQRRLVTRWPRLGRFAPGILTLFAVVVVVIPAALLAAKAVSSINDFLDRDWSQATRQIQAFIAEKLGTWQTGVMGERVREAAENVVRQVGGTVAAMAGNMARALPGQIVDLFLFLLSLYYFLRDGRALAVWLMRLSPFPQHDTEELFASIRETVNGAILGLCATSAVQGGLTMAALYIFRVPGAFLFGIVATVLAFIPMVGTTPITIGSIVYLLANGRSGAAAGMAAAAVIIGLSDNIVRPWVQSAHSGNIHPLVVLLGIFGGLELFGAAGVFIGPIVAAMAIWTVDAYAHIRLRHNARDGLTPSVPPVSMGGVSVPPLSVPPPPAPAASVPGSRPVTAPPATPLPMTKSMTSVRPPSSEAAAPPAASRSPSSTPPPQTARSVQAGPGATGKKPAD
jgi:predicted PurR-regulated permease PerM